VANGHRRVSTPWRGSGRQGLGQVHGHQAIRSRKGGFGNSEKSDSIEVIAIGSPLEEIEMLCRIEELYIDRASADDPHMTVVLIDSLLVVISLEPRQDDRKRIGLAVVVGFYQRLLS
jgi:hypothetical protein